MARVALDILDLPNRLALKALLERAGHQVGNGDLPMAEVLVVDASRVVVPPALPTLALATLGEVPRAVKAMHQGLFGYILAPLQPGEAEIMVARAIGSQAMASQPTTGAIQPQTSQSLQDFEAEHILQTLRRCNNNQAQAARELGIGRNTLWRKLKRLK